jgi:hypothetical protein
MLQSRRMGGACIARGFDRALRVLETRGLLRGENSATGSRHGAAYGQGELRRRNSTRYLFPEEIERFAAQSNMRLMASEEFMTGRRPSAAT